MKKCLMLSILFILNNNYVFGGEYIFETTLGEVCSRIPDDDQKMSCMRIGIGKYVDELAMGACDQVTTVNETIDCVYHAIGLKFTRDQLDFCLTIEDQSKSFDCMEEFGQSVAANGVCQ